MEKWIGGAPFIGQMWRWVGRWARGSVPTVGSEGGGKINGARDLEALWEAIGNGAPRSGPLISEGRIINGAHCF